MESLRNLALTRGYQMSRVMKCIQEVRGGYALIDESHPAYPKAAPAGLGDMVAAGLDAIGITKERAQAVASAFGVSDCGCPKRQQAMNEFGAKFLGLPAGEKPIDPQ